MTALPPRPGPIPRLEFAIPCRRFDNQEVSPAIEDILEAFELTKPGLLRFQLAVKLIASAGPHTLTVSPTTPKGAVEENHRATLTFTVEDANWAERLSIPLSFPCEYVGWWTLDVVLDGQKVGSTQFWVQFLPY